ncbi:MAG: DUF3043 domain-containing protein [Propionicimonas sp.]|uniref:DUF3043 domain-containing protein n=1 Tax=Propionicimonas sp. TaxID=1955623 RepID=UPI003D09E300
MGLFRPYEREAEAKTPEPEPTPVTIPNPAKPAKKESATPSRRDAEAARRERLNPTLSPKEVKARERAARASQRDEQFAKAEAAPGKVLVRDFVDAHRGVSQYAMPILMITLVFSLFVSSVSSDLAFLVTGLTYAIFLVIAADIFFMWRGYKRLHAERLPNVPLKGLLAYLLNRSINLRRLRTPAPRVKPGDKI